MGASRRVRSGVSGATWARSSPKANCFAARQSLKPLPLALGQVMSNPIKGNIAARQEAYAHCAGLVQKLRFGMPGPDA